MAWFRGVIEVRKQGAIGAFGIAEMRTRAKDEATARLYMVDDAPMYGYEPRAVLEVVEVSKEYYADLDNFRNISA